MSRVSFDENGFVLDFPYHDGSLDGVLTDTNNADMHLAFRATSGEPRILSLRGVKALDISGMRPRNIVLNLRIFPATRVSSIAEVWKKIEERLHVTQTNLPPSELIFWLESSYGAEILAVCEQVDVSEVGFKMTISSQ
jgi:hypothetical protein